MKKRQQKKNNKKYRLFLIELRNSLVAIKSALDKCVDKTIRIE